MNPKTKGKHIKKDKEKRGDRQINKTSRYILNRMIEDDKNGKGSANLKEARKGELTDLETLFIQRQDRLWNASKKDNR